MRTSLILIALGAVSLSSCNAPPAAPRTMHFFQDHEAERTEVIAKCKGSDRQYEPAEECANALRAQRQVNMDHDAGSRR